MTNKKNEDSATKTRKPFWLKKKISLSKKNFEIQDILKTTYLNTVCLEAKCPNRYECYSRGTATFLILGKTCTRNCAFCGINHGIAESPDVNEPYRIVEAIKKMGIKHAVITSVTRDDLADGGANQFAEVIRLIKKEIPNVTVEVLVPDFKGNMLLVEIVLKEKPDVFNHNIETVSRLYPLIRPQANYNFSLKILEKAAKYDIQLKVKSGIMVGLGEEVEEVYNTLRDIKNTGCSLITIGQYLRPSVNQIPVIRYVSLEEFKEYEEYAKSIGFTYAMCGPFVRSSYMAENMIK